MACNKTIARRTVSRPMPLASMSARHWATERGVISSIGMSPNLGARCRAQQRS